MEQIDWRPRIGGRAMIARLIVSGTLLVALLANASDLRPIDADETAPCEMTIEFVIPTDWRCSNKDSESCTVCRNVSDHPSELAVRCVDQTTTKRRQIPPGAELSVCPDKGAQVPASL